MKKLLASIMLVGLAFGASTAKAQTYSFDVGPSLTPVTMMPVGGASGTFHVVISNTGGTTYSVVVTGNADGNPGVPPSGTPTPPLSPIPKSGIGTISLNFNAAGGGLIDSTGAAGGSSAYVGPVNGNLGGPDNRPMGTLGGVWISLAGPTTVNFAVPVGGDPFAMYVAPHGGNSFTGTLTLLPGTIGSIHVALQDSGQQYSGDFAVTPEAGSLALLLPGLIPVGIALRRRRKSAKA